MPRKKGGGSWKIKIDWKGKKKEILEIVIDGLESSPQSTAGEMMERLLDMFPGASADEKGFLRFIGRYKEEIIEEAGQEKFDEWRRSRGPRKKSRPPSDEERAAAALACGDFFGESKKIRLRRTYSIASP